MGLHRVGHDCSDLASATAAAAAKSLQSCLTLCDPIDGSPPGYPVPGILEVPEVILVGFVWLSTIKSSVPQSYNAFFSFFDYS